MSSSSLMNLDDVDEESSPSSSTRRRRRSDQESSEQEVCDLLLLDDVEVNLAPTSNLTQWQMFCLSTYWFGWAALWMPLLVVIIPMQIVAIAGPDSKGSNMSSILMLGSIVSIVCMPLFGTLSDRSQHLQGRRRPFMVLGVGMGSLALLVMGINPPMPTYTSMFLILSISNNIIIAPYSALVPDIVPANQLGKVASWLGAMSIFGYLLGGCVTFFVSSLGIFLTMLLLNALHLASMWFTVANTPETPFKLDSSSSSSPGLIASLVAIIAPLYRHDFLLLFFSRFLTQMGIATVQEFLSFFITDAIERPFVVAGVVVADSPSAAVSIMFAPMLLGALVSSSLSGVVSDAIGGRRKVIVYLAGLLMAISCLLLTITRTYQAAFVIGGIFGCGYGAFTAVDWALVTDLLENDKEFAKDMAVWGIAMVLPNLLMPIVGRMLDSLQLMMPSYNIGYSMVFLIAAAEFAWGGVFVKYINKIK